MGDIHHKYSCACHDRACMSRMKVFCDELYHRNVYHQYSSQASRQSPLAIQSNPALQIACVAWRFCRAGRRSGVAAKFAREARENERRSREKNKNQVASAPISSRFLCPRPPLLLDAPNQNRHATQATLQTPRYHGQFSKKPLHFL